MLFMLDECKAHSYVVILSHCLLEICGLYVNSFIVDEGALVKQVPYNVEGQFIPTILHYKVGT